MDSKRPSDGRLVVMAIFLFAFATAAMCSAAIIVALAIRCFNWAMG